MNKRAAWFLILLGSMLVAAALGASLVLMTDRGPGLQGEPLPERWEQAETWDEKIDRNDSMDEWVARYAAATATVAPLVAEMEAIPGEWRLLVVTETWCGDSRGTLPYLARLAHEASNLRVRFISRRDGGDLLASNPLPDGREAIPLIVILDPAMEPVGAWIERPRALQAEIDAARAAGDPDVPGLVLDWYERDQGRTALREIVGMIKGAASPRDDPLIQTAFGRPDET